MKESFGCFQFFQLLVDELLDLLHMRFLQLAFLVDVMRSLLVPRDDVAVDPLDLLVEHQVLVLQLVLYNRGLVLESLDVGNQLVSL